MSHKIRIDDKSLNTLADALEDDWPDLALQLGFDWSECVSIIEGYSVQVHDQARHMLFNWRLRSAGGDMGDVTVALKKIDRYDLLEKLGAEVVDDECLRKLARALDSRKDWQDLAVYLGFDWEVYARIENSRDMLFKWREFYDKHDMRTVLVWALKRIRRYDLLGELDVEDLDPEVLEEIGTSLGHSWQDLARFLGFDYREIRSIQYRVPYELPGRSLMRIWRANFEGDNPVQYLSAALTLAGRPDLSRLIAPTQEMFWTDEAVRQSDSNPRGCYSKERPQTSTRTPHLPPLRKPAPSNALAASHRTIRETVPSRSAEYPSDVSLLDGAPERSSTVFLERRFPNGTTSKDTAFTPVPRPPQTRPLTTAPTASHRKYRQMAPSRSTEFRTILSSNVRASSRLSSNSREEQVLNRPCSDDSAFTQGYMTSDRPPTSNASGDVPPSESAVAEKRQEAGCFQKCRKVINKVLSGLGRFKDAIGGVKEVLGELEGQSDDGQMLSDICEGVETGVVLVIKGMTCVWDIGKLWQQRKDGNVTYKEFVLATTITVLKALNKTGCAIAGGVAGKFVGTTIGTHFGVPVLGSVIGGSLGAFIGRCVGSVSGWLLNKLVKKAVTLSIRYDNRIVRAISALSPGDQIMYFSTQKQSNQHAIVVAVNPSDGKIELVYHRAGMVVKEEMHLSGPVKKVVYDSKECRSPYDVVARARSQINKEFRLTRQDGSEFAQWCKLRHVTGFYPVSRHLNAVETH
ncbi:uncharacterized protein LOC110980975 isoform X2 [Acanthaster planci]|uniref:Uncharacterized protein LOC110980975 isoform X2 n=1 Tax=Acanthaster planci TaxID=133434 RepID=A0A8B7YMU9_ACAPL|nr:uncharacterized protein LOC110980975 isoform X2 [Acanthaster planci]